MEAKPTGVRKRTQIACLECRKNKRKCGGESPTCNLCTKSGKSCSYPSENTPRKRKYWDEDYVHSLERQIETLQDLIRDLRNQLAASRDNCRSLGDEVFAEAGNSRERNELLGFENESELWRSHSMSTEPECSLPSDRSQLAVDELSSLMLKMGIGDVGEPCFSIPSVAIEALMRQENGSSCRQLGRDSHIREISMTQSVPIDEEKEHLLKLFLEKFNSFHQFLDPARPEIQPSYNECGTERLQRTDTQFLCNAVYAAGAHFLGKEHDKSQIKEYSSRASNLSLESCSQFPGAASIKGLSLMCWVEMMNGNENLAWIYNTIATGMVLSLGFHVTALEKFSDASSVQMADEMASRVRTFWAYFSVDRIATSIMGLNCTIPWRRVRARRITSILTSRATIEEIAFDYQYQMWHLWDSVMDQVHAFAWNETSNTERQRLILHAHRSLQTFHKSIPSELAMRKQHMPLAAILYHVSYHTAVLLTYRPLLNEAKGSTVTKLALQTTSVAAMSVSRLLRRFRSCSPSQGFEAVPPQIISYIMSSAIIHLLNATAGNGSRTGKQAAAALQTCMGALEEMRESWGYRVSKAIRLIQGLAQRWSVVWALPMRFSSFDPGIGVTRDGVLGEEDQFDPTRNEAEMTDLFQQSDMDFWERLDVGELTVDESSIEQLSDTNALDWLFYETADTW